MKKSIIVALAIVTACLLCSCKINMIEGFDSDIEETSASQEGPETQMQTVAGTIVINDDDYVPTQPETAAASSENVTEAQTQAQSETSAVPEGKVLYIKSGVNVRTVPSVKEDSQVVGMLSGGQEVELVEKVNESWYAIMYKGEKRYVSSDYATTDKNYKSSAPQTTTAATTKAETKASTAATTAATTQAQTEQTTEAPTPMTSPAYGPGSVPETSKAATGPGSGNSYPQQTAPVVNDGPGGNSSPEPLPIDIVEPMPKH